MNQPDINFWKDKVIELKAENDELKRKVAPYENVKGVHGVFLASDEVHRRAEKYQGLLRRIKTLKDERDVWRCSENYDDAVRAITKLKIKTGNISMSLGEVMDYLINHRMDMKREAIEKEYCGVKQ